MRASRFGGRLALVLAALLFVGPAYAQTAPTQIPPIIRPVPPSPNPRRLESRRSGRARSNPPPRSRGLGLTQTTMATWTIAWRSALL